MHVLATAGHVDHGKSTLVRALTGMEPDRWAEERRRGMTIDLGYAWTTLPSGRRLAFVDVPGHQRFIATMLAGLGPAPAMLFVVAADGGWAPQSAEHLAAAQALGVRHAVLAVTRSDLADPHDALQDARRHLATAGLPGVRAVCVSGRTGAGLDDLRAALDAVLADLPAADLDAPVRLWIDRAFTIRGSGTVVTGTLAAGRIAVDDVLQLGARTVTVRAVQSLGEPVPGAGAVARVALNLRGVAVDDVGRGDVVLTPHAYRLTDEVDVSFGGTDAAAGQATLHVGTAAIAVRVRPLGGSVARLRLDRAVPLRQGDRAVLRDPGRQEVIAGVRVLDADPPALRRRGDAARRARALRDGPLGFAAEVELRGTSRLGDLRRLGVGDVPADRFAGATGVDATNAGVRLIGDWAIAAATWQQWLVAARTTVDAWASAHPLQPDMPLPALARALRLPDAACTAPVLHEAGIPTVGGSAVSATRPAGLGAAEVGVRRLEARLARTPFGAPEATELADLGLGHRELAAAARTGRLLVLDGGIVLLPSAPAAAADALAAIDQPFTLSQARQALATTRRVAVPLLEHLDGTGRTARVDGRLRRVLPPDVGR